MALGEGVALPVVAIRLGVAAGVAGYRYWAAVVVGVELDAVVVGVELDAVVVAEAASRPQEVSGWRFRSGVGGVGMGSGRAWWRRLGPASR